MTQLRQGAKGLLHFQKDWLQQTAALLLTKDALDDNDITDIANV